MKKEYQKPELEMISFEVEESITTSTGIPETSGGIGDSPFPLDEE